MNISFSFPPSSTEAARALEEHNRDDNDVAAAFTVPTDDGHDAVRVVFQAVHERRDPRARKPMGEAVLLPQHLLVRHRHDLQLFSRNLRRSVRLDDGGRFREVASSVDQPVGSVTSGRWHTTTTFFDNQSRTA